MCGICGVVGNTELESTRAIVEQMMEQMHHRGPHNEGIIVDHFGKRDIPESPDRVHEQSGHFSAGSASHARRLFCVHHTGWRPSASA
jgi:asparagine synthetase B (glutamine-hydrolysing)